MKEIWRWKTTGAKLGIAKHRRKIGKALLLMRLAPEVECELVLYEKKTESKDSADYQERDLGLVGPVGCALIHDRRIEMGLSQEEVAEMADLSASTIDKYEKGRGTSLATLARIKEALGLE